MDIGNKKIIIVFLAFVFISSNTLALTDGFEDGDYTNNPSWNEIKNADDIQVSTNNVIKGTYSLEHTGQGDGSDSRLQYVHSQSYNSKEGHTYWTKSEGTTYSTFRIGDSSDGIFNGEHTLIRMTNNNNWRIQTQNSNGNSIDDVTFGSWHENFDYQIYNRFYTSANEIEVIVYENGTKEVGRQNASIQDLSGYDSILTRYNDNTANGLSVLFDNITYTPETFNLDGKTGDTGDNITVKNVSKSINVTKSNYNLYNPIAEIYNVNISSNDELNITVWNKNTTTRIIDERELIPVNQTTLNDKEKEFIYREGSFNFTTNSYQNFQGSKDFYNFSIKYYDDSANLQRKNVTTQFIENDLNYTISLSTGLNGSTLQPNQEWVDNRFDFKKWHQYIGGHNLSYSVVARQQSSGDEVVVLNSTAYTNLNNSAYTTVGSVYYAFNTTNIPDSWFDSSSNVTLEHKFKVYNAINNSKWLEETRTTFHDTSNVDQTLFNSFLQALEQALNNIIKGILDAINNILNTIWQTLLFLVDVLVGLLLIVAQIIGGIISYLLELLLYLVNIGINYNVEPQIVNQETNQTVTISNATNASLTKAFTEGYALERNETIFQNLDRRNLTFFESIGNFDTSVLFTYTYLSDFSQSSRVIEDNITTNLSFQNYTGQQLSTNQDRCSTSYNNNSVCISAGFSPQTTAGGFSDANITYNRRILWADDDVEWINFSAYSDSIEDSNDPAFQDDQRNIYFITSDDRIRVQTYRGGTGKREYNIRLERIEDRDYNVTLNNCGIVNGVCEISHTVVTLDEKFTWEFELDDSKSDAEEIEIYKWTSSMEQKSVFELVIFHYPHYDKWNDNTLLIGTVVAFGLIGGILSFILNLIPTPLIDSFKALLNNAATLVTAAISTLNWIIDIFTLLFITAWETTKQVAVIYIGWKGINYGLIIYEGIDSENPRNIRSSVNEVLDDIRDKYTTILEITYQSVELIAYMARIGIAAIRTLRSLLPI